MNPYRFIFQWMVVSISKKFCLQSFITLKNTVLFFSFFLLFQGEIFSQCDLDCIDQMHLSLDENCQAIVTPETVGETSTADMTLTLEDADGNIIPDNMVGLNHVGQNLIFHIVRTCGNQCWGNILIEYKLAPKIECPMDLTLSCGGLDALGLPPATSQCGGGTFEVFLLNEERTKLDCDLVNTYIVERTYRAINSFGNFVDCSHTVTVRRVDLSSIFFPNSVSISCNDPQHIFENGFPIPWIIGTPLTGSGAAMIPEPGVPVLCDPNITNGLVCPATGSGSSGVPLIPGEGASTINTAGETVMVQGTAEILCNSAITYLDMPIPSTDCRKKIMRQWEIIEWWCSGESSVGGIHQIEVIDDEAPMITCPVNFTVNLQEDSLNEDGDCQGIVNMPAVTTIDDCGNGTNVQIDSGSRIISGNGGDISLVVGDNIVTYIVRDKCLNSNTCEVTVTVQDSKEPVAICEQDVVITLSNTGNNFLLAEGLDDGSWDECGVTSFEIRRMATTCNMDDLVFGNQVEFCCADAGTLDNMVVFRVYDASGNFNDCMVRVEVQDLLNPVLSCPANQIIDCRMPYDINDLTAIFGHPGQIDNCADADNITETINDNTNQCGIGTVRRIFRLRDAVTNDVIQTCVQMITINNNNPFTSADIIWPADYEAFDACGSTSTLPQSLPTGFDFPTYVNNDECSLLGYDYEDKVIPSTTVGQCTYIERSWTVLNWCSQVSGQFDRFEKPTPQIIQLHNTQPPVIDPEPAIELSTQNVDCESQQLSVSRTAMDDCPDALSWTYLVTRISDGMSVASGSTNTFSGTLTSGSYSISWRAEDACGNFAFAHQPLTITSIKTPTPICLTSMEVDIDNSNLETELWAADFDAGSYHACSNPIELSFSTDPTDTNITYDCDSVGARTVRLYVTDMVTMAQDFCVASVIVLDPGTCPPSMSNNLTLSGEVYTETIEYIEDVEVYLGNTNLMDVSNLDGEYSFTNMPNGGNYDLIPEKDTEHLNGVSTLDIVLIQRHILGIEDLGSPYKFIAADVNNSKDVTTVDLIEIRKLILGVNDKFENNSSWRFVDAEYNFVDPLNPWLFDYPEIYSVPSLQENINIDFIGIKIGDVNGSSVTNVLHQSIDDRNSRWPVVFKYENQIADNSFITITAQNYERVSGWQTAFCFDKDLFEILEIKPRELDIDINHYVLNEGSVFISYSSNEDQDIKDGTPLFDIVYKSRGAISSGLNLECSSSQINSEAYRGTKEIVNLQFQKLENKLPKILSVNPNPWLDQTSIEFSLTQKELVEWQFYDVGGKLLYSQKVEYNEGENIFKIKKSDLNTTGVVYVKLITQNATAQYKMMVID